MDSVNFTILGNPKAKQSARFAKRGKFLKSYQPKEVVDAERNLAFDVKSQLPPNFIPFDEAIGVHVNYYFPPLSSWSKKLIAKLNDGVKIPKITKPDLTDNLNKMLFDALEGIVYVNDSRICKMECEKIYSKTPRIELEVYKLEVAK